MGSLAKDMERNRKQKKIEKGHLWSGLCQPASTQIITKSVVESTDRHEGMSIRPFVPITVGKRNRVKVLTERVRRLPDETLLRGMGG